MHMSIKAVVTAKCTGALPLPFVYTATYDTVKLVSSSSFVFLNPE